MKVLDKKEQDVFVGLLFRFCYKVFGKKRTVPYCMRTPKGESTVMVRHPSGQIFKLIGIMFPTEGLENIVLTISTTPDVDQTGTPIGVQIAIENLRIDFQSFLEDPEIATKVENAIIGNYSIVIKSGSEMKSIVKKYNRD